MRVAGASCRVCAPIIPNHYVSGYPKLHAKEVVKQMNIGTPIDQVYPKVKPLAQALIAAAKEQEATVEDFRMACARVEREIERKASGILFSELKGE